MNYFDENHMPYAILAIVFLVISTVFPIIFLIAYPCRCCQSLLNRCKLNSRILRTFMDSVQGAYKDGDGNLDCRWFSALDFLFRVILYLLYMSTLGSMFFTLAVLATVLAVISLVNINPYKESVAHYTKIDATFYLLLALFYACLCAGDVASLKARLFTHGQVVVLSVTSLIPLFYMIILCLHWLFATRLRRLCIATVSKWRAWRRGYDEINDFEPDRLENPQNYIDLQCSETRKHYII